MSDQRVPRTRSETAFWIIACILAVVFLFTMLQSVVGLW
ncbi:hypothetical protein Poly51_38350 [Rubripirellula tenax]|uniref:Uncharacterized protein n=1 Tax=Rubripirellula tenax TaxID=2528015 RepID=A0A5C6ELE5_9BACT|nr:hypothetical protein Poly51_38350 [Rubripirellula tenax]